MQLEDLTNDGKFLLASMYKKYVSNLKRGMEKQNAVNFGTEFEIHDKIMSAWSQSDVHETISELSLKKLLTVTYGSNVAIEVVITTDTIVMMEHKFQNRVDSVISYVAKIKALIPFI